MRLYSAPINVVRYDNGTLVKLTANMHEFISYDWNPTTSTGTFLPSSITINATYEGNVGFGRWEYTTDGTTWETVTASTSGVTFTSAALTVQATSNLFSYSNSAVTFRCVGNDEEHADTMTIMRTVDPTIVYQRVHTEVEQTNEKIALIASEEQLAQYSESYTMVDKMASIELKADTITSTVTANYATKAYADSAEASAKSYADSVGNSANDYADSVGAAAIAHTNNSLANYSTTAEMQSQIQQSATAITQTVATTYATKQELADAEVDGYLLQTPYTYDDGLCNFSAVLYRNSDDVTANASDGQFEWFLKTEATADRELIGTGKTLQFDVSGIGYGGSITCRATVLGDEVELTDHTDDPLVTHDDTPITGIPVRCILEVETSLFQPDYLEEKFAQLTITDSEISSVVSQKVGYDEVVSSINQTAESIKISANKVELSGYVTFTNLSTEGQTSIDGGNIITGSIEAEQLATNSVTAEKIAAGSVTANSLALGDFANYATIDPRIPESAIPSNYYSGASISGNYAIKTNSLSGYMLLCPFRANTFAANDQFEISITGYAATSQTAYIYWIGSSSDTVSSSTVTRTCATGGFTLSTSSTTTTISLTLTNASSVYINGVKYYAFALKCTGQCYISRVTITHKLNGSLIVDGSITADNIEARTITADEIAVKTITGGTNGNLALGTITGGASGNLALGTITGGASGNIATGTITGGQNGNLALNTITAANISTDYLYAGTIDAGLVNLKGNLTVHNSSGTATGYLGYGSGSTSSGGTEGIHMYYSGSEMICTSSGARMTASSSELSVTSSGVNVGSSTGNTTKLYCYGDVEIRGTLSASNHNIVAVFG